MVKGWAADITPLYDKEIYIKYFERLPLFSERKGNGAGRSFKESAERGGMESVGEVEEEIQTSEGNSV